VRAALDEARQAMLVASSHQQIDKANRRSLHLTITALPVPLEPGCCPALDGEHCAIYAERPATCRSVPLHYSRPDSTLARYLDQFVATPGYRCDTGAGAPVVLANGGISASAWQEARLAARSLQHADRPWKEAILRRVLGPASERAGLP